jgi:hypothetical protein
MDVSATFLPIGVELIDNTFPTDIVYRRHKDGKYDPLTGEIIYSLIGALVVLADYANASVTCGIGGTGDYNNSDVSDGAVSICDNHLIPAGTADYDNADIQPRSAISSTTNPWQEYPIKAGVLNRSRVESDGTSEAYEVSLWVHHGASGLAFLPTTADSFMYDTVAWKVVSVEPTYSSATLIASKIKGRSH